MNNTKILKLQDGFEIEVEINEDQAQEISSNSLNVDTSLEQLQILLTKVIKPISSTYKELSKDMNLESAKISIGVKIGIEGNFILAKSTAGANIQVELTMKAVNE